MLDPREIRRSYGKNELNEGHLTDHPMELFDAWFRIAVDTEAESNAFVLSTSLNNIPNSRVVLLKGYDDEKFIFFTNYKSEKGVEINGNENVAMNFFWENSERQIRVLGKAFKVSAKESDDYFNSRPFGSRIGAIASSQSEELESMDQLIQKVQQLTEKFSGEEPPRPEHWGGYFIDPHLFEFWQGKPDRLHDRFQYTKVGSKWAIKRLFP